MNNKIYKFRILVQGANASAEDFENAINEFIADKRIKDVQFTTASDGRQTVNIGYEVEKAVPMSA